MEIRPARAGDIDQVLAIERASFVDPWSRNGFAAELVRPGTLFWVIDDNGVIAGYIVVWDMVDYLYVANIAVEEARRGTGLGKALIRRCVEYAVETGRRAIVLDVRVSNTRARKFYEGLGFVKLRQNPGFYGKEDGITYVLRL